MAESKIVRDYRNYASYQTVGGLSTDEVRAAPVKDEHLNLDELSIADIKAYVNSGELSAEDVYAHESAAEHPRKGLLKLYAPEDEEAKDAPEGDEASE